MLASRGALTSRASRRLCGGLLHAHSANTTMHFLRFASSKPRSRSSQSLADSHRDQSWSVLIAVVIRHYPSIFLPQPGMAWSSPIHLPHARDKQPQTSLCIHLPYTRPNAEKENARRDEAGAVAPVKVHKAVEAGCARSTLPLRARYWRRAGLLRGLSLARCTMVTAGHIEGSPHHAVRVVAGAARGSAGPPPHAAVCPATRGNCAAERGASEASATHAADRTPVSPAQSHPVASSHTAADGGDDSHGGLRIGAEMAGFRSFVRTHEDLLRHVGVPPLLWRPLWQVRGSGLGQVGGGMPPRLGAGHGWRDADSAGWR